MQESKVQERRSHPLRIAARLVVGSLDQEIPFAQMRDLSESGVYLVTTDRPTVGTQRNVSFLWGEELLSCTGRVVRLGPDGLALEFVDPTEEFREALRSLIAELGSAASS